VHNDEVNTFDWVIKALIEICEHSPEQAEQCTLLVHFKGKCSVKSGSMDVLKPMREGLTDRGIGATIE
jgi:ATP-dependent Clp protease adaptor protein ClpS